MEHLSLLGSTWQPSKLTILAHLPCLANFRTYIATRTSATIELIAKIEAFDSLTNLDAIIAAADGVMVARGDLGAQVSQWL